MMEVNEYQKEATGTAVYPGVGSDEGLVYVLFGMLGEAGELANKFKKIIRRKESAQDQDNREVLMDKLGDVLWYASAVASELGYDLEEVCRFNLGKLAERKAFGTLKER